MHTATRHKFRDIAETMRKEVAHYFASRHENTPKRQREAKSARIEGAKIERAMRALLALAEAHESGTIPAELAAIKTKGEVLGMVATRTGSNGYYDVYDTNEFSDTSDRARLLRSFVDGFMSSEERDEQQRKERERKIRDMEANLRFADIDGFFPTPPDVVRMMTDMTTFDGDGTILEPSAGLGHILDAAKAIWPNAGMVYCERHCSLHEVLQAKGYSGMQADFMEVSEEPFADLVLMNPPFENQQDMKHIMHAWTMVKPRGELVAIASAAVEFGSRKTHVEFRDWTNAIGATVDRLPDDSFNGKDAFKKTGVSTVLLYARKR